ncbi:unnamed protein product, partial [Rotaria sp. Silwood2]
MNDILYEQPRIEKLHGEQQQNATMAPFNVFRGQGLLVDNFEKIRRTKGKLMSFNNFLPTSRNRNISLGFAHQALSDPNSVGILFAMKIDPKLCAASSTPFVH